MTTPMDVILADFPIPKGSRVLVCGGRDYKERSLVWAILDAAEPSFIVTGGQGKQKPNKGADLLAETYAQTHKIPFDVVHADWEAFGRAAGPRRNSEMLLRHPATQWLIAFPGGKGTADMIKKGWRSGVPSLEIREDGNNVVTVEFPKDL